MPTKDIGNIHQNSVTGIPKNNKILKNVSEINGVKKPYEWKKTQKIFLLPIISPDKIGESHS